MEEAHQDLVVHQMFSHLRNKVKLAHQEPMEVTVNKLILGLVELLLEDLLHHQPTLVHHQQTLVHLEFKVQVLPKPLPHN